MKKTYNFVTVKNYPVITVDIMGVKFNLLIDTGSNINTIDFGCDDFEGEHVGFMDYTTGVSLEEGTNNPVFRTLMDGVVTEFTVHDLSVLRSATKRFAGVEAVGMIGSSFMWKHKAQIDYENNTITFTFNDADIPVQA